MSSERDEVVENKAAEEEGGEAPVRDGGSPGEPSSAPKAEAEEAEKVSEEEGGEAPAEEAPKAAEAEEEPEDEGSATEDAAAAPAPIAAAGEHGEGEEAAEEDRPHNGVIAVTIITTLTAVVLSVLGVREVYNSIYGSELDAKVLHVENPQLRELRADEQGKLDRYQWVSKKDGVVRVPLDRAIQLTVADYRERAAKAAQPKPEATAAPEAPKPDGSAQPEAPKGDAPSPVPPTPEPPKEH